VLLWSACMAKKRIAVVCDRLPLLLRVVRSLPLFVWQRQEWDLLRPWVLLNETELTDLKKAGVYWAGFTDTSVANRTELWDVLVDVNERSVIIGEHAKADLHLTAFQKELAGFLVEKSEDESFGAPEMVKALALRTRDFIGRLQALADESGLVSLDSLRSRLPAQTAAFLFAVATAEGIARR